MKRLIASGWLLITLSGIFGQQNIMDHPATLIKVENCLYCIYGLEIDEAVRIQAELQKMYPDHPVSYFLKAMIIYWVNYPLSPDDPLVKKYERNIDLAVKKSTFLMNNKKTLMEGIFFDMHARAFRCMYWADNGKPVKVLGDLDNLYRNTMKGIEYKEIFNEFYFSSGLYNYYVQAYVDMHPVYKPIASLFRKGNKTEGIKEIKLAIDNGLFIKYEAMLFMTLLQLYYENNLNLAENYIEVLCNNFPENNYYLAIYLNILLHNKKYKNAGTLSEKLENNKGPFEQMIHAFVTGFVSENNESNYRKAIIYYKKALLLAESLGPVADLYASICYAGLARISETKKDYKSAKKYWHLSKQKSRYDFIFEFQR